MSPSGTFEEAFNSETLEEATYLSHLFFGYKLPKPFANRLNESLRAIVARERTRTELLSLVEIPPRSWKKVQVSVCMSMSMSVSVSVSVCRGESKYGRGCERACLRV